MTIFSGRFDQYDDETVMIDKFYALLDIFDGNDGVLTFEDQTKTGIPCKPHYHFVFKTEDPKATHDKIRRWISQTPELRGTKSSLKSTDNYDKALIYILKQYPHQKYVPFSDLSEDELQHYIDLSIDYNQNLKLNSWKDHLEVITEQIRDKYKFEPHRLTIMEHIGEYVYEWNNQDTFVPINLPTNLKPSIVYIEQKVLPKSTFMQRFLLDNQNLIYEHEVKEFQSSTKITQIRTGKLSNYFIDSDTE